MFRARWLLSALMIGLVLAPPAARARALGVDVWTDRGKDAVYEPGEPVEIKVRASDDAYVLVYDIDSEGYVRVLYPQGGNSGYVVGRHTYRVPAPQSDLELVVQGPVGEGYIVALASSEPFSALPWYLRPYDPHAEGAGYVGEEEDNQEDVTSDGRIVGDPFVAMERIRRKVLEDPNDQDAFATAYTSYYVHQPVRYPRYLCNDCHRPSYWAWWDGWDPYYSTCSAFDFRVYWGWSWGPRYWFGNVPYFCYVPRCYPCAPYDRPWYSSWGGRRQWNGLWSGHLSRVKSPPPPGYTPPSRYDGSQKRAGKPLPPGFLPAEYVKGPGGVRVRVPIGANRPSIERPGARPRPEQGVRPGPAVRPGATRGPANRPDNEGGVRYIRPQRDARPMPGNTPPADEQRSPRRYERPGGQPRPAPAPRYEQPRGQSRPAPAPRYEQPRGESRPAPARAPESRPAPARGGSERSGGGSERGRSGERPGRR
jgi:hypothetical protein